MHCDHLNIENLFLNLFGLLGDSFSMSERSEVQEFIDVGEYGIALETLVDIVTEEDKKISNEAMRVIGDLSLVMQLDKNEFEHKLRDHID